MGGLRRATSCHSLDPGRTFSAPVWVQPILSGSFLPYPKASASIRHAAQRFPFRAGGADFDLRLPDSVVHLTFGGLFLNYDWPRIFSGGFLAKPYAFRGDLLCDE